MNFYFLCLGVLLLFVYCIFQLVKKPNHKLKIYNEFLIGLTVLLFLFVLSIANPLFRYSMSSMKAVMLILSLAFLCFSFGWIDDDDKTYRRNIDIYIGLYTLLLISITFLIGRPSLSFDFKRIFSIYRDSFIPFHTISSYFTNHASLRTIVYNIFGNIVMLVPLSFLLMLKNKKYDHIGKQLLAIAPMVLIVELLQEITWVGSFDVDDILLNLLGVILFTIFITRFDMISKIRKLFFTTFKNKKMVKYFCYGVFQILPIMFIVETVLKIIKYCLL